MLDERSEQAVSTPFHICKNKENVEAMLNESLNQFKFDSTLFQQAFNIFTLSTMLNDLFKRPQRPRRFQRHSTFSNLVEGMLKQMLKPFKRAQTIPTCINFLRKKMKHGPRKVNWLVLACSAQTCHVQHRRGNDYFCATLTSYSEFDNFPPYHLLPPHHIENKFSNKNAMPGDKARS